MGAYAAILHTLPTTSGEEHMKSVFLQKTNKLNTYCYKIMT